MPKKNLKYLLPLLSLLLLVFFSYHPLLLKAENTLEFCTLECEKKFFQEYNKYPSTDEIAECITECQQIPNAGGAGITFENPLGPTNTLGELVNHILAFALKLAIPIATIMIVWSGFLFATSAGNEEKIKTAQKTLIWAIVGLGVAVIATTIPALVREFLGESKQTETINEYSYNEEDPTLNKTLEGFTIPIPPASEIKAAFIYNADSATCQKNKLIFTNCCKATQTTGESSYQCKNWLDIH